VSFDPVDGAPVGSAVLPLLAPDEPHPVVVERAESRSPLVFVCDHAGRRLPRSLGDLGLSESDRQRHIAYDIGVWPVAQQLARAFDAPLVGQRYSRLVIDCNRPTHVPASIPEVSETTPIPGNRNLDPAARQARIDSIFTPYHDRIEAILDDRRARGIATALIAVHSFTPVYTDVWRPWVVGLLYDRDARLANVLRDLMNEDSAPYVGDQLPYAVSPESDYTIPVHGERRGLLHVGFEIRQDLLTTTAGQDAWAAWLEPLLRRGLDRLRDRLGDELR
jgi:predicted N-formylglutamate amidohydrolase